MPNSRRRAHNDRKWPNSAAAIPASAALSDSVGAMRESAAIRSKADISPQASAPRTSITPSSSAPGAGAPPACSASGDDTSGLLGVSATLLTRKLYGPIGDRIRHQERFPFRPASEFLVSPHRVEMLSGVTCERLTSSRSIQP